MFKINLSSNIADIILEELKYKFKTLPKHFLPLYEINISSKPVKVVKLKDYLYIYNNIIAAKYVSRMTIIIYVKLDSIIYKGYIESLDSKRIVYKKGTMFNIW